MTDSTMVERRRHDRRVQVPAHVRTRPIGNPAQAEIDRFWASANMGNPEDCWIWVGGTSRNNRGGSLYGVVWKFGGVRSVKAHRVAYLLATGPIPDGMVVRHMCDTPLCVNPSHLEVGTQRDNVADRERRKRSNYTVGNRHGNAKLSEDDAREIRRLVAAGVKRKDISDKFRVSPYAVYNVTHTGWRHVK